MTKKNAVAVKKKPQVPAPVASDPFSLIDINGAARALGSVIPLLRIEYMANPDTPPEYEKGKLTWSTGGQCESVTFVWLAMSRSRILWPDYDPKDDSPEPLCQSLDAETPVAGTDMRSGPCSKCSDGEWVNSHPPTCAEVFTILGWDMDQQAPFIFAVKRTGIRALRRLKSALKQGSLRFGHPGLPVNCAVSITLDVLPRSNYYIPRFTIQEDRLTKDDNEFYANLAQELLPAFQRIGPDESTGS